MNASCRAAPRTTLFAQQPPVTQSAAPTAAAVVAPASNAVNAEVVGATAVPAAPVPTVGRTGLTTAHIYAAGVGHGNDMRLFYVLEDQVDTQASLLTITMSGRAVDKLREAPRWSLFSVAIDPAGFVSDCDRLPDETSESILKRLRDKFARDVSSTNEFESSYAAIRVKDRQVLFVFKGEVRLPIASMRRVTSSDKKTHATQARVEVLDTDFKARPLLFTAATAQFLTPGDRVRANAIKIQSGAMLLIDCSAIGSVKGKLHDVSFEFTNEFPPAQVEFPQRIVLGCVTSCESFEKRDDRTTESYKFLVPVEQAQGGRAQRQDTPLQPPAERTLAANTTTAATAAIAIAPVAAVAGGADPNCYYKVALMSVLTRSYLNAWCSAKIRPGTLCHLDESVDDQTGATQPVRLLVLNDFDDFVEWQRVVARKSLAHTGLDMLKKKHFPQTPLPLTRAQHLKALVSAQIIDPTTAMTETVTEAEQAAFTELMKERRTWARRGRTDKRTRDPEAGAVPPTTPAHRPVHGCLPPVWIEITDVELSFAGGTMADVMRVVSTDHDPADILGAVSLQDAEFRRPTATDGYSPMVFLVALLEEETVLTRFVATDLTTQPAETPSWAWHQDGPEIHLRGTEALDLLEELATHLNPRKLVKENGKLTLHPFFSWEMEELTAQHVRDEPPHPEEVNHDERRALVTTVSNADLSEVVEPLVRPCAEEL